MNDQAQAPALGPMLLAIAAAVAVLMAVTGAQRRVYPDGPPEMVHWGLLAFGVLASTAVYTLVMRALTKKR